MLRICIVNDLCITLSKSAQIMAEDTRKSNHAPSNDATVADESAPLQKKRKHDFPKTQAGKMWEAFGNPAEPVNEIPGGTYNSAGGKPKEVTWKDAFNWKLSDAQRFYRVPCARDALLVGGGGGAAVGGLTAIVGGKINMIQDILIKKKFAHCARQV
jgi:cytochrome c oxidase assembly protein subunit 20